MNAPDPEPFARAAWEADLPADETPQEAQTRRNLEALTGQGDTPPAPDPVPLLELPGSLRLALNRATAAARAELEAKRRAALLAQWEADPDGQAAVAAIFERKAADQARQLQAIETAMAYTTWDQSCKDPHLTPGGDLRECRRPNHHPGAHASGHSENGTLIFWNAEPRP